MTGKERTGQFEHLIPLIHDSWFLTLFFGASHPVFGSGGGVVVVVVLSPLHPGLLVLLFIAQKSIHISFLHVFFMSHVTANY